jgi:hypothetical protein
MSVGRSGSEVGEARFVDGVRGFEIYNRGAEVSGAVDARCGAASGLAVGGPLVSEVGDLSKGGGGAGAAIVNY